MRKRALVLGLMAIVVALLFVVLHYGTHRVTSPTIKEEQALRIVPGMSATEVKSILGPPRDETYGRVTLVNYPPAVGNLFTAPRYWISDEYVIVVYFSTLSDTVSVVDHWRPETLQRISIQDVLRKHLLMKQVDDDTSPKKTIKTTISKRMLGGKYSPKEFRIR